jgi:hypothetical protein
MQPPVQAAVRPFILIALRLDVTGGVKVGRFIQRKLIVRKICTCVDYPAGAAFFSQWRCH